MRNINGVSVRFYELAHDQGEVREKKAVSIRRPVPKKQEATSSEYEILDDSLPRFGPIYGTDQHSMAEAKEKAWQKVLPRSESREENNTFDLFLDAIKRTEREARATYAVNIAWKSFEFVIMMIRDGCFFLQLTFLILGKYSALEYPEDDPIFGRKQSRRTIHKWINAMFFVGNQIPLVVLKELIKQKFFQDVIAKENWSNMRPFGLCKRVLYEQLIAPELEKLSPRNSVYAFGAPKSANCRVEQQQPCDILHALQIILLGPVHHESAGDVEDDDFDLDDNGYADEDDISNHKTTSSIPSSAKQDDQNSTSTVDSMRSLLNEMLLKNAVDSQNRRIFSSTSELKQSGIHLRKLQSGGIRRVHFKNYYISAFLYLPGLQVDDTTEMIFHHLKTYENCQPLFKRKRELSSYLRLMTDLIKTPEDVRLLKYNGIIEGRFEYAEPEIFCRLSSDITTLTQELRNVRSKIADYSSPWIHYRRILDLVVFLTLLQTLFTVLGYFKPPK